MSKLENAFKKAKKVRSHAHAPYSKFKVGAAVIDDSGKIFTGCNVENASYGGTICAERVAITKAVSEGASKIKQVVVVTDAKTPTPPCGFCRQVMNEFMDSDGLVHIANTSKILATYSMNDLDPLPFKAKNLK